MSPNAPPPNTPKEQSASPKEPQKWGFPNSPLLNIGLLFITCFGVVQAMMVRSTLAQIAIENGGISPETQMLERGVFAGALILVLFVAASLLWRQNMQMEIGEKLVLRRGWKKHTVSFENISRLVVHQVRKGWEIKIEHSRGIEHWLLGSVQLRTPRGPRVKPPRDAQSVQNHPLIEVLTSRLPPERITIISRR